MSIVVAHSPDGRGKAGLELGRLLAASSEESLVVVCVVPARWQPISTARAADKDYQDYLRGLADDAIASARTHFEEHGVPATYDVVTARSAPAGLLAAAQRHGARLLVAGPSSAGPWGHIALGSVTDSLMHSSPVPIAIPPRGFHIPAGQEVDRITVAHDGGETCQAVLTQAAAVADTVGATLRVVTFAVRTRQMIPPSGGLRAEDQIIEVWRRDSARRIKESVASLAIEASDVETVVAEAKDWASALDVPGWTAGDVLVVGSSSSQPFLSRVFLGSTATRIVRHSPVPVVVVP